jgi:hypothetical protein
MRLFNPPGQTNLSNKQTPPATTTPKEIAATERTNVV